jgi:hypothetical protein
MTHNGLAHLNLLLKQRDPIVHKRPVAIRNNNDLPLRGDPYYNSRVNAVDCSPAMSSGDKKGLT